VYFDRADQEDSPTMLQRASWGHVKRGIRAAVAALDDL
jgi:hypothetical protein